MIKENILYPEVNDTEDDIESVNKDLKDFENLNFLREETHSVLEPAKFKREVLSL